MLEDWKEMMTKMQKSFFHWNPDGKIIMGESYRGRYSHLHLKVSFLITIIVIVIFSGCINPFGQVPVIKINITLLDNKSADTVDTVKYTFSQGNVSYLDRPKKIYADSFPAIAARETLVRGKLIVVGPWEMTNYTGSGTYNINIGFRQDNSPTTGDNIHITIMVVDKDGTKIGYVVDNLIWK